MQFVFAGRGGVQFWLDAGHDLFVTFLDDAVVLSFDGFTPHEQEELLASLAACGVHPRVDEDAWGDALNS